MSLKPTDTLAELASQADWYEQNITNKYCIAHISQFAFAFFAISLVERITTVEL